MNDYRRIANEGHEEEAVASTRSHSRHGLSNVARKAKRSRNRAATRSEARMALAEQLDFMQEAS